MSIKLNAQSGGSVALDAPTQTTSSADLTFKLPVADGSVGQVLKTDGSSNLSFGSSASAGQIIETVTGICDGRSITVGSGSYTLSNVTAIQDLTSSYVELNGSSIAYTPPSGTKQLIYRYTFQFAPSANSGISHYKVQVDGTDILPSRITMAGEHVSNHHHHSLRSQEWIFDLTESSDDIANGKIAGSGWTSNKTLRVVAREYDGSSYQVSIHKNDYWEGTTAGATQVVVKPRFFLQAIA